MDQKSANPTNINSPGGNLSGDNSTPNQAKLKSLEDVIRNGQQTFLDVANALAEIMEAQLYRLHGFGSFAEYCETVWGFKKATLTSWFNLLK